MEGYECSDPIDCKPVCGDSMLYGTETCEGAVDFTHCCNSDCTGEETGYFRTNDLGEELIECANIPDDGI